MVLSFCCFFFFQAEDGIRDWSVTGVQTCALPIYYYLSKGLAGRVFVQPERALQLEIELRHDWQQSVAARDPWTVFRNDQAWRHNRSEERRVGKEGGARWSSM